MLEPCAVKVASTVLRGGIPSNGGVLLDSINKCNFAILHCFGKEFKPRFTNLNNELKNICGSSDLEKYSKYKIAPTKLVDRDVYWTEKSRQNFENFASYY